MVSGPRGAIAHGIREGGARLRASCEFIHKLASRKRRHSMDDTGRYRFRAFIDDSEHRHGPTNADIRRFAPARKGERPDVGALEHITMGIRQIDSAYGRRSPAQGTTDTDPSMPG